MILVIDNYDSFTYNLVHYLNELGRRDRRLPQRRPDGAGGPGPEARRRAAVARPQGAGPGRHLPAPAARRARGSADPGRLPGPPGDRPGLWRRRDPRQAGHARQGQPVRHNDKGIFKDLPNPFTATRYHSLAVRQEDLPPTWRSRPGPTTARSWACSTGPAPCSACSSTRNPSPPRAATRCWPTSWTWPASSA